jgi:hypothetical protein
MDCRHYKDVDVFKFEYNVIEAYYIEIATFLLRLSTDKLYL